MRKSIGILHIDDDEDDGFLFHSALKEIDNSITYIFYQDAQKALKDLKSFTLNPDYIFLDLNMPKMNGIEALGELKTMKRLSHIPIIICSTSNNKEDIAKVMTLGAAKFISKPNSVRDMVKELRIILLGG